MSGVKPAGSAPSGRSLFVLLRNMKSFTFVINIDKEANFIYDKALMLPRLPVLCLVTRIASQQLPVSEGVVTSGVTTPCRVGSVPHMWTSSSPSHI
jgi:hypothetical protein